MFSRVSSLSVLAACLAAASVATLGAASPSFSGSFSEKSDTIHSPIKQVCDPVNDYSGCRSS